MENVKILASYATLKELFGKGNYNSYYQLISEYIKYIAYKNHLYELRIEDISSKLEEEFGFCLPLMVIKNSIKSIDGIISKNDCYLIESVLDNYKQQNEILKYDNEKINEITKDLFEYAKTNRKELINENELSSSLIAYLIDDKEYCEKNTKYIEIISKYIVHIEEDKDKQKTLASIREGSIIYMGLSNSISEIGGFRKRLSLYLDTEILFNIAGYNGEIYKQLSLDMMNQIKLANRTKKVIDIKYFDKTKEEIDNFFKTAEEIVENNRMYIDKPAMVSIITGCKNRSDVLDKKADFYTALEKNGIDYDSRDSFYVESNYSYILEGSTQDKNIDEYAENIDYINRINILRKGKNNALFEECEYLFVTETRCALELSREMSKEKTIDYAVNTNKITNLIWFKLGSCFNSSLEYPSNCNLIFKAKTILSNIVVNSISKSYSEYQKQYHNGEIDKKTLENRIIVLHEKASKPEEINKNNIDETLDFSTNFFINYENAIFLKEKEIKEKDKKYSEIVKEKENEITNQNKKLENLEKELIESKAFENRYKKLDNIINLLNRIAFVIKGVICDIWQKALLYLALVVLSSYVFNEIQPNIRELFSFICEVFGAIIFIIAPIVKSICKQVEKVKNNRELK